MIRKTSEFAQNYNASLNNPFNRISIIRTGYDKGLGKKQEKSLQLKRY